MCLDVDDAGLEWRGRVFLGASHPATRADPRRWRVTSEILVRLLPHPDCGRVPRIASAARVGSPCADEPVAYAEHFLATEDLPALAAELRARQAGDRAGAPSAAGNGAAPAAAA